MPARVRTERERARTVNLLFSSIILLVNRKWRLVSRRTLVVVQEK